MEKKWQPPLVTDKLPEFRALIDGEAHWGFIFRHPVTDKSLSRFLATLATIQVPETFWLPNATFCFAEPSDPNVREMHKFPDLVFCFLEKKVLPKTVLHLAIDLYLPQVRPGDQDLFIALAGDKTTELAASIGWLVERLMRQDVTPMSGVNMN